MSVHISSIVWKAQLPSAGMKLVLLALADVSNHEGEAWPGSKTLQAMTCLGETAIKTHVKALREAGILEVEERFTPAGRQTSNNFRIITSALENWGEGAESDPSQNPPGGGGGIRRGEGAESDPSGGRNPTPQIRTDEPPIGTVQKEPVQACGSLSLFEEPPADPFPKAAIRDAWNRLVPSLAKIQGINGERERHARARYKTAGDLPSLEAVFARVEASDFLTNRSPGTFHASFDWVINPANFDKIREGKYDNGKSSRTPTPTPNVPKNAAYTTTNW